MLKNCDRRKIEESYSLFKKLDWLALYISEEGIPKDYFQFLSQSAVVMNKVNICRSSTYNTRK